MSDESTPVAQSAPEHSADQSRSTLQKNSLNWRHVTLLSLAGCGPAASVALNLQFMG